MGAESLLLRFRLPTTHCKGALCLLLAALFLRGCALQYAHTVRVSNGAECRDDSACCTSSSPPCCSLSWVRQSCMENDTQVVFTGGTHALEEAINFTGYENIALRGEAARDGLGKVTVECVAGAGLSFFQCRNISLDSIEFLHCGSLQNSTSRANGSFVRVSIAIYLQFCLSINLTSVNVTNSTGVGVAFVACGGANHIQNGGFYYNVPAENGYGGGGLQIEFPYCSPRDQTVCRLMQDSEHNSDAVYEITSCVFEGNSAGAPPQPSYYQFLPPKPEHHISLGRGGGLGLHFCKASNNRVEVRDTSFVGNRAYYGAGISCSFEEYSVNNTVLVAGSSKDGLCRIANNVGWMPGNNSGASEVVSHGAGGGIRAVFWFSYQANNSANTLNVTRCHFRTNNAYYGGAMLVKASPETMRIDPTNSVSFVDSEWVDNRGHFGGVALITTYNESVERGALLKPTFEGCVFWSNYGNLVVSRLPIAFKRSIDFLYNAFPPLSSGVLTVDEATVEFHESCKANFTQNRGHYGGAITLYGHAFLRVFPNTQFLFKSNYARRDGGAIYQSVPETQVLQNGPCFMQYSDRTVPPADWNTSFLFDSNEENLRTSNPMCNSILLGSVVPCIWDRYAYEEKQNEEVLEKTICTEWSNILEFSSENCKAISCTFRESTCNNCTQHIHTKPSTMTVKSKSLAVTPGQPATLGLGLVDDLGSNVSYKSVLNVWTADGDILNLSPHTLFLTGDSLAMYGTPGSEGVLDIDTLPPLPLFKTINISFLHCPPGFVQHNISSDGGRILPTCKCVGGFGGGVTCDGGGTAYLRRGYWIGKIAGVDDDYLVGPTAYIYSQSFSGTPLPKTGYSDSGKLNDMICGPLHRESTLCGRCKNGYTPPLHGYTLNSCVHCDPHDGYGWIFVVALELVPVTIFLVVVLIFNISATTGAMNFFVFFAQVITNSFSVDAGGYIVEGPPFFKILSHLYNTMYILFLETRNKHPSRVVFHSSNSVPKYIPAGLWPGTLHSAVNPCLSALCQAA